jgi:hypothetical protein
MKTKAIITATALTGMLISLSAWKISGNDLPANKKEKVLVCHRVPGNSGITIEIMVSASALPAHLAHGDQLGSCTVKHNYCSECVEAYQDCLDKAGNHEQKMAACEEDFALCSELYCVPAPKEPGK